MTLVNLIAFLRARYEEEEQVVPSVHALACELTMTAGFSGPCTCGWPDRLQRNVDAKRRGLDECAYWFDKVNASAGRSVPQPCLADRFEVAMSVLRALATSYAAHPDYRPEWAP